MPESDVVWYGITGGLFIVYAVLDAPGTGIGIWYLFFRPARRRSIIFSMSGKQFGSILWLAAALGALWFGFPGMRPFVRETLGPALIAVFISYSIRITAIRHRERVLNEYFWDWIYALSGILPPLVFGMTVGCLLEGVPLGPDGVYAGTISELFSKYSMASGATAVFMYATAASLNWAVRTDDTARSQALRWARISWVILLILFIVLSYRSVAVSMYISQNFILMPILLIVPFTSLISLILIPILIWIGFLRAAYIASLAVVVTLILTFGISLYPFLVPVFMNAGTSLTIENSVADPDILSQLVTYALVGTPLLAVATILLNRKGKDASMLSEDEVFDSLVDE